jgi:hypothetical protein
VYLLCYIAIPVTGHRGPQGCETLRLHHCLDNRLIHGGQDVSFICQPPYTPRKISGTHFCQRLSQPQGHSMAGRIRSTEKSNDLIGNWTHDLPACSTVPQPTTLLNVPVCYIRELYQQQWGRQRLFKFFFGLFGECMCNHCYNCSFVSTFTNETQLSSPVTRTMWLQNSLPSLWYHPKKVRAEAIPCILCAPVSIFEMHVMQNLW